MTRYLVATASSATTTAACEYLREKLEADDVVYVLTVDVPDETDDREAALEVAQVELTDLVEVRTIRRDGRPAQEIVAYAREADVDEIIMGPSRTGGVSTVGSTTRAVPTTWTNRCSWCRPERSSPPPEHSRVVGPWAAGLRLDLGERGTRIRGTAGSSPS